MKQLKENITRPTLRQIEREIKRLETTREVRNSITGMFRNIMLIAALAVLSANLLFDVVTMNRSSMSPILQESDVVIALRVGNVNPGDIVAFYYNNKILIKRVIAQAGDWVDMNEHGVVYVNGEAVDEPYVTGMSLKPIDIDLPFQVPDSCFFLMGDHREMSADSRLREIGAVNSDMILGKVKLRIWPLTNFEIFR